MIILIGACGLFLLLLWLIAFQAKQTDDDIIRPVKGDELAVFPFEPMPIMTDTEVIFFQRLQQAFPDYLIFSQVQLSRIIAPIEDDDVDANFWFNRICRMSVDYVLVDKDCQTVLVAIELDDWTHQTKRRQQQDEKKDKALSSAGIAIIRFHGEAMPDAHYLRESILNIIQ